jgi:UDP-N-acetylglucosamine diphosphorylase/glucosamine-1-phosphate N-acetyltransferase
MLPISYTRAIGDVRVGILTLREKWEKHLNCHTAIQTVDYLQSQYAVSDKPDLLIHGSILPSHALIEKISQLLPGQAIYAHEELLIARCDDRRLSTLDVYEPISLDFEVDRISRTWDIFSKNGQEIRADYTLLTANRESEPILDDHTITYGNDIFLEEGASVKAAILNAENGPIYLGKNAKIEEGAIIRGPFALCESSVVNTGGKMRGDSTIGPHSKVGGEITNCVILGYSNKGHDGFLGNSVIGEWCNLGADTNNSNLKNNYASVKMWDYAANSFVDSGLQFCGLIMGDHSKCGINTMFNTGTTIGVSANIFGEGFPRNLIPSFAWGGNKGFMTYQIKKVFETARLVMERRGKSLTETEQEILSDIFEQTAPYRNWEK